MLIVIASHPVQYHVPVWRECVNQGLPIHVIYGSDFSVVGAKDEGFGVSVKWDRDLTSGYPHSFLEKVETGGAKKYSDVRSDGLLYMVKSLNPTAMMVLGYASPFDRAVRAVGEKLSLPMIFRGETTDLTPRSWLKSWVRSLHLRRVYRRFSALNYIGACSKQHFKRLGVSDKKLFFSPYCVDAHNFELDSSASAVLRTKSRSDYGAQGDDVVIIFSGKLIPLKAPDMLLLALASLPVELRSKIILAFLGDGEMRSALEQSAASLKLRTVFLGFQNQSKLSSFYHGADVLALPTKTSETWGLVVNEALLHGLPVLVSNTVSSAYDLIKENTGEIFERGNQADLNAKLLRLIQRLPELKREDCMRVVADYSVNRSARGIFEAYHHALTGNR
jgi:glycosyltransferase involved in cell wall biosynthesis